MKVLTRSEEEIMQIIWKLKGAFLRDILNEFDEPKPHSNTVSTILKILVEKEFAGIEVFGRTHRYFPLVSKEAYSKSRVKSLAKRFFEGSFTNIVSSMIDEKNLSVEELELLVKKLKKNK